jgi:hypothetical protein
MEPEAVVCVNCGLDLRAGVKAKTTYDVISRRWDAGLERPLRLGIFAGWQCVAIPPLLWGIAQDGGHAPYAIVIWLWFSFLAAFLAGTYNRLDLHRSARGRVRLVKTWYFCFYPCEPEVIDFVRYEGILTGQTHELGFSEYLVFAAGIFFFIIPGIVWYFAIMQRDTWYVALTTDHGRADMWLYRGWSEDRAKQIAGTIRTAVLPEYAWY